MKKTTIFFIVRLLLLILYGATSWAGQHEFNEGIEILEFKVDTKNIDQIIKADKSIWTDYLTKNPSFEEKYIGINPEKPDHLYVVIHWKTWKGWKNIPQKELNNLQKVSDKRLGDRIQLINSTSLMSYTEYKKN